MLFNYKYGGETNVDTNSKGTHMSFAPDVLRNPVYFVSELHNKIPFREAISTLHNVVVSDLKFRPKDKTEYKAWLEKQEEFLFAQAQSDSKEIQGQIQGLQDELNDLRKVKNKVMLPYYKKQKEYFNYLYKRDYQAWLVLDPVITIHPDQVFFECFSKDESTYGNLACSHNVFNHISEFSCGTTNIDYSYNLYDEFQKIRDYRRTFFQIDPSGFNIQTTGNDLYKEVKIDLPESWVRGFLQVSSAMDMQYAQFDLHPVDIANCLFILKRQKEKQGPRYLEYILEPGKPVQMRLAPWDIHIHCPRSIYKGDTDLRIKTWGRRRLLILERLLPICKKIHVSLIGNGMPSFYVAEMDDMQFTLGLSGWTNNDWTNSGNFDLMGGHEQVDGIVQQKVFLELSKKYFATTENLVSALELSKTLVKSALKSLIQTGRVIYDLHNGVYRLRELNRQNISVEQLKFSSKHEEEAFSLVNSQQVKVKTIDQLDKKHKITGRISNKINTEVVVDEDLRIVDAKCTCSHYNMNKLYKGPCAHILALKYVGCKKINF